MIYGSYYAEKWKEWVKHNSNSLDIVFMNRPHISVKYMDFIKKETKAKVIYYGHDLHYLRLNREYQLTGNEKTLKEYKYYYDLEYDLMSKADVVYYPSVVEVTEIKQHNLDVNVKVLSPYIMSNIIEKEYTTKNRRGLLFVGGFAHGPNVDAVLWFCNVIMPLIVSAKPEITFEIVGSNPTDEVQKLASRNVIVHGYVTDEELRELYDKSRLAIIPLRYGAGIKGKVIEAMSNGVPVVTTSCGAEGIENAGKILSIEDSPVRMANLILQLYEDERELCRFSKDSYQYIRDYYSEKVAWDCIKNELV